MKTKILSLCLSFLLVFSTVGFSFAETDLDNPPVEPTKPSVESYKDNDKIEKYNKQAEDYNKQVNEYNNSVDKEYKQAVKNIDEQNAKEKERVDQVNKEKQENYEKEMVQYEKDKEQYKKDKEYEERILADPRYDSIEQYNEVVTEYNNQVDARNQKASKTNKALGIKDEVANDSPQRNVNAKKVEITDTYTIIEAETKSNRKIPVHIEHIFSGTDIAYQIDFEIDANDTIILRGIAPSADIAANNSCLFFYNTDGDHCLGVWTIAISSLDINNETATVLDGWQNGNTHTITYSNSNDEYLQQSDAISITYEYYWIALTQQEEHVALANTPIEPTLPDLTLEEFIKLPYPEKRAYLNSLALLSFLPTPDLTEAIEKTNEYTPVFAVSAAEVEKASTTNTETKQIKNNNSPKTITKNTKAWALINLITTLLTFIIAILLLIASWINKKEEDNKLVIKNKTTKRIISIIIAILSGIIFLITEDTSLPMGFIDWWTPIMFIIFLIQIIILILYKYKKEE